MFGEPEMAWNLARLEAHYFRNVRFQPDTLLLDPASVERKTTCIGLSRMPKCLLTAWRVMSRRAQRSPSVCPF